MTTLQEKWAPVLDEKEAGSIQDSHRRAVTAQILENQEKALAEERSTAGFGGISEAAPTNISGQSNNWDPVLISLVRRAMPNLMAFDVAGVQAMTGPTGLIFAMSSKYADTASGVTAGDEALHNVIDTGYAGKVSTAAGEALTPNEMSFAIDKTSVTAQTRALAASYSTELAQDLKAIHGLDAESELAGILTTEILAEMNRELLNTINSAAVPGTIGTQTGTGTATINTVDATAGTGDLDGRWNVERFKALHHVLEREANGIATATRRGKGNFVIVSADVASSLAAAGVLDYAPAMASNLNVDATGNTFAGLIGGRIKVYIDPLAAADYFTVGYKGSNAYDAGLFYCPYVPLTMMRATDQNTFQPKIGFKTRYGLVSNPFTAITDNGNVYYRTSVVTNL